MVISSTQGSARNVRGRPSAPVTGSRGAGAVATVTMLAVLMAAGGCQRGWRIGSWQVIDPKEPLFATRIEVKRGVTDTADEDDDTALTSRLTVDLVSGRAALIDGNGEPYPVEIDPDMLESLRTGISDRSWQVKEIGPSPELDRALVYEMTVYVGEERVKPQARWHMPAEGEVPASLDQVSLVFNDAARSVDPLSNRFDLLD